jgi:asparagine synthase (glutamine-hydrolysing)
MNSVFSLKTVSEPTQLDSSDILRELVAQIATYREEEMRERYVHFMIYENAMRQLFEGEDRNRAYFWSVSPFYSIKFYDYVMNCPDNQKSWLGLYNSFLRKLSKKTVEFPDSNVGIAPASRWHGIRRAGFSRLLHAERLQLPYSTLKLKLSGVHSYDDSSPSIRCLRDQAENCKALLTCLSKKSLRNLIDHHRKFFTVQMDYFFTVTSAIQDLTEGSSSIERFAEESFV